MRPRVFPAEDFGFAGGSGFRSRPSMRPRVFPAEDSSPARPSATTSTPFNEAAGIPRGRLPEAGLVTSDEGPSMRPRVFPAEDSVALSRLSRNVVPSMRPRVFPAEDRQRESADLARGCPFNEAAGIPRGRHRAAAAKARVRRPSMRPRVFPAEDPPRGRLVLCD